MLASLTVQDVVLIDRLGIEFGAGLTVLTGETGAGKSILLDALALALGARGDAALVRAGAERGQITAVFEPAPDHPAFAAPRGERHRRGRRDHPPPCADGRRQDARFRQRPALRRLAPEGDRRAAGRDPRPARRPRARRRRGASPAARRVRTSRARRRGGGRALPRAARNSKAKAAELRAALEASLRDADYLRASVEELEALAPEAGEETALADRRQFLMRAEKIAGDLNEAHEIVGGNSSPIPELVGLARRLERKSAEAPGLLEETVAALGAALDNLEEVRRGLEAGACALRVRRRRAGTHGGAAFCAPRRGAQASGAGRRPRRRSPRSFPRSSADIDLGDAKLRALEAAAEEALAAYRKAAKTLSDSPRRGGEGAGESRQRRAAGAEAAGGALHRRARGGRRLPSRRTASTGSPSTSAPIPAPRPARS